MESNNNQPHIDSPEFKTDEFRMYGLKVIDCPQNYCHEWTTCPFAHQSEKARRRDPRKFNYMGVACPMIKQSNTCPLHEHCQYAHNVFEYWLHPSRYKTQFCNIAASCNRTVCFFAHTIDELRVPSAEGHGVNNCVAPSLRPSDALNPFSDCSQEYANMFSASKNPADATIVEAYANNILRQLVAFRQTLSQQQQSLNNHQSSSANDFIEIQRLLELLQRQQSLAGLSEYTSDIKVAFTSALLQSLSRAVNQTAMQHVERERLTKLFHWIHFQMIQKRQFLFRQSDAAFPFAAPQQTDMSLPSLFDGERLNLPQIPEMGLTYSLSCPSSLCRTSQKGVPPLATSIQSSNIAPDSHLMMRPSHNLAPRKSGYQWRWPPSQSNVRMSDESTVTWLSTQRTSSTFSLNRSSADDSETQNRRSWTAVTNECPPTAAMENSSQAPEFICHDMALNGAPPPSGNARPFM